MCQRSYTSHTSSREKSKTRSPHGWLQVVFITEKKGSPRSYAFSGRKPPLQRDFSETFLSYYTQDEKKINISMETEVLIQNNIAGQSLEILVPLDLGMCF